MGMKFPVDKGEHPTTRPAQSGSAFVHCREPETQGVMGEGGMLMAVLQEVIDPVLPHGRSDAQRTLLLPQKTAPSEEQ